MRTQQQVHLMGWCPKHTAVDSQALHASRRSCVRHFEVTSLALQHGLHIGVQRPASNELRNSSVVVDRRHNHADQVMIAAPLVCIHIFPSGWLTCQCASPYHDERQPLSKFLCYPLDILQVAFV